MYIHQASKLKRFAKDSKINVGNIPFHLLLCEIVLPSWKPIIEFWLLLPHTVNSMNGLYIQNLITKCW